MLPVSKRSLREQCALFKFVQPFFEKAVRAMVILADEGSFSAYFYSRNAMSIIIK